MIDPRRPDYAQTPAAPGRPAHGYAPADPAAPPALTIVTPFYNTGPVFDETARSVLGQTLQQWEWVIVDDGSTDPAATAMLDAYRNADQRVRVIRHQANRGLPASRNTGYAAARSPYVLQLDSDDMVEPTAAEVLVWFLESCPAAAFAKGYTVGFGAQEYLWTNGFHSPDTFLRENIVDATAVVRVDAYRLAGGYDEARRGGLEDWDFWLRCAEAGLWGDTVPLFLDWYRRRHSHADRWDMLAGDGRSAFLAEARRRYPQLWSHGMPRPPREPQPAAPIPADAPFANLLRPAAERLLVLLPDFGPAAGPALAAVRDRAARGVGVTVAALAGPDAELLPAFAQATADVFALPLFLDPRDYPRFLAYLLRSRGASAVATAADETCRLHGGYLLARAPGLTALPLLGATADAARGAPLDQLAADAVESARRALARVPPELLRPAARAPRSAPLRLLGALYRWLVARGLRWLRPARDALARHVARR